MIIQQAIRAIDPAYEITAKQQREIDSADDPEGVAAVLAEQVELNRQLIAQGFGVSPEHVTAGDGLSVAVLKHPVANRVGSGVAESVAEMVSVRRALEIGRRSVKPAGFFERLYLRHIGKIDPVGLAWWETQTEKWFVEAAERDGTLK